MTGDEHVFTVGHSTRSADELLAFLREHDIRVLVDVRRFPGSRRYPHFSAPALAAALGHAGIQYRHEPDLGGRREPIPDSPNTAWRVAAFRGYADHMGTREFGEALARVRALARERRACVMCAEAVPWRCHRQLIADALVEGGVRVTHILGPGRAEPHRLHAAARLEGGRLVYQVAPQKGLFGSGVDRK